MAESFKYTDSAAGGVANLFHKKYGKYTENYLNRANKFAGRVKTVNDISGDGDIFWGLDAGYIGGAGGGVIPKSNRGFYLKPSYTPRKLFVASEIDNLTREMALQGGAWVESKKEVVKKTMEAFMWLQSFTHFSSGNGAMGTIDTGGVTDNGSGSYSLVISAATYVRRIFNRRQIVNIGAATTDRFEITEHVPSTRTITVQRVEGSSVAPAQADVIYLQGMYNVAPISLTQICDFTSSTLFGETFREVEWSPKRVNASNATISVDMLNEVSLGVAEKYGKAPTAIYLPYKQLRNMLNSMEDRKNYLTEGEVKNRKGDYSYSSVMFHSVDGPVPIMVEPFIADDRIITLVEDEYTVHRTENSPQWEKDDKGAMEFLKQGDDAKEMRYKSYQANTCNPTAVGLIYGLG